jgi:hypothetical protein
LQRPEDCQRCHALLRQRGQSHYERHDFTCAINLLTPAVFFSTSLTVGKSALLLAVSLAKAQQPQKALQYIGLAEQQEGCRSALGCLIRLQVQLGQQQQQMKQMQQHKEGKTNRAGTAAAPGGSLDKGKETAAAADSGQCLAAVDALSSCTDFTKDTMQVGIWQLALLSVDCMFCTSRYCVCKCDFMVAAPPDAQLQEYHHQYSLYDGRCGFQPLLNPPSSSP